MRPTVLIITAVLCALLHASTGIFFGTGTAVTFSGSTLAALLALKGAVVLKGAILAAGGLGAGSLLGGDGGDDHDDDHYGYDPYGHHDYGYGHSYGYSHHDSYHPKPSYGYHPKPSYGYHPKPSYGYNPKPSYGYGASHHRRRRDTYVSESKLQAYMDAIESIDKLGCVPKLLCELEVIPETNRDAETTKILDLFDKAPVKETSSAYDRYKYAAYIGASGKSKTVCSRIYFTCPFETSIMLAAMKS